MMRKSFSNIWQNRDVHQTLSTMHQKLSQSAQSVTVIALMNENSRWLLPLACWLLGETSEFIGTQIMKRGKKVRDEFSSRRLLKIVFIPFRVASSTNAIYSVESDWLKKFFYRWHFQILKNADFYAIHVPKCKKLNRGSSCLFSRFGNTKPTQSISECLNTGDDKKFMEFLVARLRLKHLRVSLNNL